MKNITIDMWKCSPVFMKCVECNENSRLEDYDTYVSPIVSIICKHFIDEEMQMRRCAPYRYRILEKDLNNLNHTIL
jgi:hypothetical protein